MAGQLAPKVRTAAARGVRAALCAVGCVILCAVVVSCQHEQTGPTADSAVPVLAAAPTTQNSGNEDWKARGFAFGPARDGRDSADITTENRGCIACHKTDAVDMHSSRHNISCIDCHGGNASPAGKDADAVASLGESDPVFIATKDAYHVHPTVATADLWKKNGKISSANPEIPFTRTLAEDINFIRFVNPGDLMVADMACGACHNKPENPIVAHAQKSMMAHGGMLWEAALYNNGAVNRKDAIFGEAYTLANVAGKIQQVGAKILPSSRPTRQQKTDYGWLTELYPLPRWEVSQPGNILRVFERGGKFRPIIGIPDIDDDPGHPDVKLSVRGFGTDVRTDPVFLGLQKTRLFDPTTNFFGTNDNPGDYRASGCSSCHVVYSNDRSPVHSAKWAKFGNRGESFSSDVRVNPKGGTTPSTTRPVTESGHPVAHTFEKNVPTSSCIVCHVHPGTNVVNAYLGFTWWDNETDGELMYPKQQIDPSEAEQARVFSHNPEGASVRGLWKDPEFLANITNLNKDLKHTQFADFHGHGWVFRAVYKQDRHGNILNTKGAIVEKPFEALPASTPENKVSPASQGIAATSDTIAQPKLDKTGKIEDFEALQKDLKKQTKTAPPTAAVHLKDIHLEKGMQCVDCHFQQDAHGDGHLYGETRNAVMVGCVDCHGSSSSPSPIIKALDAMKKSDAKQGNDAKLNEAANKAVLAAFSGPAAVERTDGQIAIFKQIIKNHFARLDSDEEGQPSILFQKSALEGKKGWVIKGVMDTVGAKPTPLWASEDKEEQKRAALARYAHSVRKKPAASADGSELKLEYGFKKDELKKIAAGTLKEDGILAHANSSVSCYACHSSWNTSCFGCHLAMKANQARPSLHAEGQLSRNYTNYNFQTLRDDLYMLGVDSTVKHHTVTPVRSACAVLVSSQDANRQWIYQQQQTVSAEGFAGTAFSPYFPHTVRTTETKTCVDCHIAKTNDNNAVLSQLLMQGTNAVNFIGRFAWVAEGEGGLEAVVVTERDEPQAVIGSKLQSLAFPRNFAEHQKRGKKLTEAHEHEGTVFDLQLRGEYLYAACGEEGFIAYDVANVDNKGFSERISTAPVSPLGQRLYVRTPDARCIVSPSTLALDPTRDHREENQEQNIHLLYAFLYVADTKEGLVVIGNKPGSKEAKEWNVGVATLLDGDPENNFLTKALSYNPSHFLDGAKSMALYGHYMYVCCDRGVVVVNLDNPLQPKIEAVIGNTAGQLKNPRKIAFQFRYAFVVDEDGLKVLDVTNPANPKLKEGAILPIADARDIYLCRTFGYVAAGANGLVIVDLENPEALRPETISEAEFDPMEFRKPAADRARRSMRYNANGKLGDTTAVKIGMTNNSLYAYVADGRYGLKVLRLTSDETPGFNGFSPIPSPDLIAEHHTHGPALAIGKGLDRDRAVDESGNQLSVFGRRGARPFNLLEQRRMYLQNPLDPTSPVWKVSSDPKSAVDVGK